MTVVEGMLWFDESKKTVNDKVVEAVKYYWNKYKKKPTWVRVNPATKNIPEKVGHLVVIEDRMVLPHHFWIGNTSKNDA